ncbi:alpha/beta fold hydrolase [Tenacibaculum amylolyticum]|uniref:alpha/beta fold hydrolase n=1 Tax=Tenacibaculum amylolyticum TaxID=104269 RepID=UPI003895FBBF
MYKSIKTIFLVAFLISSINSFGFTKNISEVTPTSFLVETIGKGKPVLYLPGFATPGSIWKETVENINLDRKSYLFSYAGFNGNAPIKMPWYATIKNDIISYVKDQNMSDVVIIGHSMGGNLAVDIAAALPNKISKIIIVDALPCMREVMMPNVPAETLQYESPYNNQMLNMDANQFNNMAKMMAANMTYDESKKETLTNWITKADRKTWVFGYTDLLKLDLREALKDVNCEVLILGASFPDVVVAEKNYQKQYANLANKTLKMASKSKHFVMFDQPEWFYTSVNDFLINETK